MGDVVKFVGALSTVKLYALDCCTCGIKFALPAHLRQVRVDDHALFYCPNGHAQRYSQERPIDTANKEIAELKAQVAELTEQLRKARKPRGLLAFLKASERVKLYEQRERAHAEAERCYRGGRKEGDHGPDIMALMGWVDNVIEEGLIREKEYKVKELTIDELRKCAETGGFICEFGGWKRHPAPETRWYSYERLLTDLPACFEILEKVLPAWNMAPVIGPDGGCTRESRHFNVYGVAPNEAAVDRCGNTLCEAILRAVLQVIA